MLDLKSFLLLIRFYHGFLTCLCIWGVCICVFQVKELVNDKEFERYDQLLLQSTLETMADIVYCPRHLCESPVIVEDSNSKMGRCPSCQFVFCTLCKLSYHGLSPCRIKSGKFTYLMMAVVYVV